MERPEFEIIYFAGDVITASPGLNDGGSGSGDVGDDDFFN